MRNLKSSYWMKTLARTVNSPAPHHYWGLTSVPPTLVAMPVAPLLSRAASGHLFCPPHQAPVCPLPPISLPHCSPLLHSLNQAHFRMASLQPCHPSCPCRRSSHPSLPSLLSSLLLPWSSHSQPLTQRWPNCSTRSPAPRNT